MTQGKAESHQNATMNVRETQADSSESRKYLTFTLPNSIVCFLQFFQVESQCRSVTSCIQPAEAIRQNELSSKMHTSTSQVPATTRLRDPLIKSRKLDK
jgi:hypothetical protein